MSALISRSAGAAVDYPPFDDQAALPQGGAVLVSFARWERDRAVLTTRGAAFGVRLPNTLDVQALPADLLAAELIVLDFPSFGDGRAYSQARLLREARGYRGELRATGAAVVRDQLLGMIRCGIDSFVLRDDQSPDACEQALREFSMAYQPAMGSLPYVRAMRRRSARN